MDLAAQGFPRKVPVAELVSERAQRFDVGCLFVASCCASERRLADEHRLSAQPNVTREVDRLRRESDRVVVREQLDRVTGCGDVCFGRAGGIAAALAMESEVRGDRRVRTETFFDDPSDAPVAASTSRLVDGLVDRFVDQMMREY